MDGKRHITTRQAAELLQVNRATVRGMCERGELEGARRVGGWWRIPLSALEPFKPLLNPQGEA